MKAMLVAAVILFPRAALGGTEVETPSALGMMDRKVFRACGLHKLSKKETGALNAWLSALTLGIARETVRATAAAAAQARQELTWDELSTVIGGVILAHDGQSLGVISRKRHTRTSIANSVGDYGSSVGRYSIFNSVGSYGSTVSALSPFNSITRTPPRILKGNRAVAYLTVNKSLSPRVHPAMLLAWVYVQRDTLAPLDRRLHPNRAGGDFPL